MTREAPMVMMMRVTVSAPLTGSMASFFDQNADHGRHQDGQPQGHGQRQAELGEEHRQHAAQHDELTRAKLMTLLAL